MLTDWDKEYIAVLHLGVVTDTQDMTGRIIREWDPEVTGSLREEAVRAAVMGFLGEYDQIPPMYSALKIGGKKLYELARAGKEVERRPRRVQIRELEIQEMELPRVTMRIVCSKGTYIRTLCHDIGERLGCGGAMESLVRSRVGIFGIEEALTLEQIEDLRDQNRISDVIIKPDAVFGKERAAVVSQHGRRLAENGNALRRECMTEAIFCEDGEKIRVYDEEGRFYGIYQYHKEADVMKPIKIFLLKDI